MNHRKKIWDLEVHILWATGPLNVANWGVLASIDDGAPDLKNILGKIKSPYMFYTWYIIFWGAGVGSGPPETH